MSFFLTRWYARWWKKLSATRNVTRARRPQRPLGRLRLETLEDRCLPTSTLFGYAVDIGGAGATVIANAVATDNAGNAYVTGYFQGTVNFDATHQLTSSGGSQNAFVAKYSSSGVLLWADDLGSGSSQTIGQGIAVDGSGNVYTTGYFAGTGSFSGTGSGDPLTTGDISAYVSKLDASGNYVWADDFGNSNNPTEGQAIAVDGSGNVYTTGYFDGTVSFSGTGSGDTLTSGNGSENAYVSKLNASGNYAWADDLGSGSSAVGQGIAVDGSGNVYTTGNFQGIGSFSGTGSGDTLSSLDNQNAYISKLNSSGNYVWADDLGNGSSRTIGQGIAVDGSGNVFTTGTFQGTGSFSGTGSGDTLTSGNGNENAYVSKLDASGTFVWADDLGSGSNYTYGQGIAVDGSGNVYTTGYFGFNATGSFSGTGSGDTIYGSGNTTYVSKLNAAGSFVWADGLGGGYTFGQAIAVDGSGNVYTTGGFESSGDFSGNQVGSHQLSPVGSEDGYLSRLIQPTFVTTLADTSPHTGISLRDAIADALPGGYIEFQAGLAGPIDLSTADGGQGTLTLSQDVTILGPSNDSITIEGGMTAGNSGNALVLVVDLNVTATLDNLVINNGYSATVGGGIDNAGTLTVTNCTFNGNSAAGSSGSDGGGAIYNSGSLTVTNCTIANNEAAEFGAGIRNDGTLSVTDSTFTNNSCQFGGGIFNNDTATVTGCTFSQNVGLALGGGICNFSTLSVTNSTFTANRSSYGGGIFNDSTLSVTNATIADNLGGGGISNNPGNYTGPVTLVNTLLAMNNGGDYQGTAAQAISANNLIDDSSSGLTNSVNGNIIGGAVTDVGLDPNGLQNNGGPTQTIALLPGSQAIGGGSNSVLSSFTTDQRGVTRNSGSVDIGAYQSFISVGLATSFPVSGGATVIGSLSNNNAEFYANESPNSGFPNFQVESGTFPPGFTLQPGYGGAVTGAATAVGNYSFIVSATENNGFTGIQQFNWTVIPVVNSSTASLAPNAPTLIIHGNGFDSTAANDSVILSSGATGYVSAASGTQLTVTLTAPPTGGPLTAIVTTDGFSSVLGEVQPMLTVVATVSPVVSASSANLPNNARALTIDGYGFDPKAADNSVILSGATGYVSAATASQLTVTFTSTPALGSLTAVVTTNGYTSGSAVQVANVVTFSRAAPVVNVTDVSGPYNGFAFSATATVAGVVAGVDNTPGPTLETVPVTVAYYAGAVAGVNLLGGAPVHPGTYTVVASFAGSADYTSGSAQTTFQISQATPTVTASATSGTYNGSPFAAAATIQGVVASGPNQDNIPGTSLESVTLTLDYLRVNSDGTTTDLGSTAPVTAGAYVYVAHFAGSADYTSADSVVVAPAGSADDPAGRYGSPSGRFKSELVLEAGQSMANVTAIVVLSLKPYDGPGGTHIEAAPAGSPYTYLLRNMNDGASHDVLLGVVEPMFVISPAPLFISADAKFEFYGQANPTFTASYSGFVNGDTPASLTGTLSLNTTATTGSGAGTYPITVSGVSSSNYNITFLSGSLFVTPAPLTISADSESKIYGQANPTLTASYSGFVNGDTASNLTGTLSLGTTAATGSAVGSYPITPSGLSSANYNITYVNGTLSVLKAEDAITFGPIPVVPLGSGPVTLNAVGGGSSSPVVYTVLIGPGSISSNKLTVTGLGTILIEATQAGDANYQTAVPVFQTVQVETAQTITFKQPTSPVTYGVAPITLSAASSSKLPVTFSVKSGPGTISGNKLTVTGAGSIVIAADQAGNSTYTPATEVQHTLVVNKATLTVAANNASWTAGKAGQSLAGFTISGFVNGDTEALLFGAEAALVSCSTVTPSNPKVGTYTILVAQGTLVTPANYTLTFKTGKLTVH